MSKIPVIEYMCTFCGKKETRSKTSGRPMPGSCPRKPPYQNGITKPHSWRINRVIN